MLDLLLLGGTGGDQLGFYITLGVVVALFIALVLWQSFRRKKAEGEYSGMLDQLGVGTRVKTVGGVIGIIKEMREEAPGFKTVLLETGDMSNPTLVLYDLQAIYGVVDDAAIAKKREEAEAQKAKAIEDDKNADDGVENAEKISKPKKTKTKGE